MSIPWKVKRNFVENLIDHLQRLTKRVLCLAGKDESAQGATVAFPVLHSGEKVWAPLRYVHPNPAAAAPGARCEPWVHSPNLLKEMY